MTNLLLERLLRYACFTFLAVMLVLVLTACGPGGGGTGTGPIQAFSTASVGADGTADPAGGPIAPPGTGTGTVTGTGGSGDGCGRLDLQLEAGRIDLVATCGSFAFVGGWAADPSHQIVVSGVLKLSGAVDGVPATLLLQFAGAPEVSQTVTVTVLDAAGRALLGPALLGRSNQR